MVVGDFVVAMSTSTDARSVAWSGIRKHDFWTFGQEGSDFQSFPDGGDVMNGVGSQSGGIIFQEKVIREMYFVPNSRYTFGFGKYRKATGWLHAMQSHGSAGQRSISMKTVFTCFQMVAFRHLLAMSGWIIIFIQT